MIYLRIKYLRVIYPRVIYLIIMYLRIVYLRFMYRRSKLEANVMWPWVLHTAGDSHAPPSVFPVLSSP